MAIAPSNLGRMVFYYWSSERALVRELRTAGLVSPEVPDDDLKAVFRKAKEEHAGLSEGSGSSIRRMSEYASSWNPTSPRKDGNGPCRSGRSL